MDRLVPGTPGGGEGGLTTHKAAGWGLEDAGSLQALRVGAGGVDPRLQPAGRQPLGQPLQLAVTQEAVALQEPAHARDRRRVRAGRGGVRRGGARMIREGEMRWNHLC